METSMTITQAVPPAMSATTAPVPDAATIALEQQVMR